jgi:ATP-dependent helicase/nuclease subunit A
MPKLLQFPSEPLRDLAAEDAEAREQALNPQQSFLVEAPAGSGKTALLVQRFLGQLLDPDLESPGEVLAITFTRKATAELLERVVKELVRARQPLPDDAPSYERTTRALALAVCDRSRERGWGLEERPGQLNIRSLDSVCAAIASAVPVLSGAGGPRTILEDARTLYRMAARRTLFELGGSDAALHAALRNLLLHRDAQLQDTERLLAGMLAAREQWGELIPLDPAELTDERLDAEVRPRLEAALESIVCAGLTKASRLMPASSLGELSRLVSEWSHLPGYKGGASPLEICRNITGTPTERAESLDHWRVLITLLLKKDKAEWRLTTRSFPSSALKFEVPKGAGAQLLELVETIQNDRLLDALCEVRSLPPAKYPDEQWAVAKSLFHVLRRALAELKLLFAERSECDFAEMSLAARQALEAEPTLGDTALAGGGGRLRHLLVDEMQDTSAAQYELLEQLTRSWDGHSQTLFLVGDPKQSIYLFRQARVERFVRAATEGRLGELPLQTLQLNINFRSQNALIQGVNSTFENLFPAQSEEALANSDVPFVEAVANRPETFPQAFRWHGSVVSERSELSAYRQQEAKEIRKHIQTWLQRELPEGRKIVSLPDGRTIPEPWSLAVLARNRNHLAAIAAELRGAGIAFKAVDIESLAERQEVLDAMALTRALLHPADRIAWLAVLRAPWCGLGLADLLALTSEGADADRQATVRELVAMRREHVSAAGQRLLDRAWPVLEAAVEARGATGLTTQVERTWRSLGGDLGLSPEACRNAERFFRLVGEVERLEPGRIDLRVLEAKLADLYAEPATLNPAAPRVELMTIHRAKGLEWDVVLVPGLDRKPQGDRGELLNWIETDNDGVILAPISGRGEPSSELNDWLRGIRAVRDRAERKRIFYVACTRAREELHLFAALPLTSKGILSKPLAGSLLEACWPAAQAAFVVPPAEETTASTVAQWEASLAALELEPLALAAAAETEDDEPRRPIQEHPQRLPHLQRLPLGVETIERFRKRALAEPAAEPARFERPEGSFAARAFGNVMHRFLELASERLAGSTNAAELASEVSSWGPRLRTSLCAEGIPPSLAEREAQRALAGLRRTLNDPLGLWVLGPQSSATSEAARATSEATLRADRTFAAGQDPGAVGDSHLWIIDFKTTERSARAVEAFREAELANYLAQMERYATMERAAGEKRPMKLALFYPLDGTFLCWESEPLLELRPLSL